LTLGQLALLASLWLSPPAGALAATFSSAPSKASAAQEELQELKSRIDAIQKRLAEAEESKTEAADALRASERSISDANRALAQLNDQSRTAGSRLAELKREIDRIEANLKIQRATLGDLLYRQYIAGRPEVAAVLLNGQDPNAVARELHYLGYLARARADLIAKLRENLSRVGTLAEEAENRAAELADALMEQSQQRKRLEQEQRARARVLTRIARDIEQQQREIGTLRRDEARLTRLVDQLAKVIARTPRPRAAREVPPRFEPKPQNDRLPQPADDEGSFARLKGRLALPVRGELANRFGSPRQDSGLMWKGLFIAARGGEDVRAIAPGRVVFADWLRGFGNLLIVDHGEGYMSLYGYNETLYKQVGDVIRGGERIATVGNSGGQPDSGLYFEMRHEGRPFDPMTWVPRK
jgi:septal ring factor EnvC (AmiA/AmiB activator)